MSSMIASLLRRRPRHTSSPFPPSSSSHDASQLKYDVFISFRGSETRRGFLSHLVKELSQKQIEAYTDYKLKKGDELSLTLCRAIEQSQIALVILSKNYASSKWCLEELVKITECMMDNGQIVVPIFYNVDPSDVRHQKGCYKNAFAKHEKLPMDNKMNVGKWRAALKKVANLSGFHSTNFGTEAELIEEVVQRVLTRLNHMHQVDLKGLVGIHKPIAHLRSLIFCNGSEEVRVVGIWGIGGIGKTTIAGALFNTICSEFEGCYFLANVREQLEKYGIVQLRDKLLSILLEEKDVSIATSGGARAHVLRRLGRKRILVVLDDVNNSDVVTDLIGGHDWLGPGSRIIVTTRDKHVIRKADDVYEVELLGSLDALQLLNLHAFDGKCIQMNWQNLMLEVVQYAKGIPLALKVLGSFLCGKSAEEWESQLHKLQKMAFPRIQNVLRLSYEGLDIFLYIACFFKGSGTKYYVKVLLDACGYSTSIALKTLQDRAIIAISNKEDISVHDLIQEMGREIIREQSIEKPGERSHLWDPNEICRVLEQNEGTEHIESITLDLSRIGDLSLSPHSFARMVNLKLLRFYSNSYDTHSGLHLPEGLGTISSNIRLFQWDRYPSKSFPATFNAENLVELRMQGSHVKKLWDGAQNLKNMRSIDLSSCEQLIELPDLSKASSLKYLHLDRCASLVSIHPSILSLQNIEWVNLSYCRRLEKLPAVEALPWSDRLHSKLEYLNLNGCESLKYLPDSISKLTSLTDLNVTKCKELDISNLQITVDDLQSLMYLYLDGCCKFHELPENIGKLSSLCWLSLVETNVKSLPKSIKHLLQLERLYLNRCRMLRLIPEPPASLYHLEAYGSTSLERVFNPSPQLLEQHIRLAIETDDKFKDAYFSFKTCPNLDRDALDAILAYVDLCNERRIATWREMHPN